VTCAELKELVGAYAIGALSPDEKAACDAHLASAQPHDGCWEALRAANEAAALVALSVPPVEPSPQLWSAIESKLEQIAQTPRHSASWLPWLTVAALLVLVVFIGRDRTRLQDELATSSGASQHAAAERATCLADLEKAKADVAMQAKALQLLQRSGVKLVAMAPQAGSTQTANVIFAPDTHEAYVVGHGLAAPADKDFELWLIRGDRKIAAGLLKGNGEGGSLIAQIAPEVLGATPPDAFAVTLEPKGGGEQPRGTLVLVGKI